MHLGAQELIIILLIILILFGADKLPKLAKGLGEAVKEFRKSSRDDNGNSESKESKDNKS
ncbi:MAG: twin-arginine translocase TatA/TatE family subunit [Candidatus Hydrothermia bacterium]|mgnify:FL=1|jgi:sec-independent protein translocase protein TatA